LLVLLLPDPVQAQIGGVQLVFMEHDAPPVKGKLPSYRVVFDLERIKTYSSWMNNEPARMALDLYKRA
jgi:hypothetical protein